MKVFIKKSLANVEIGPKGAYIEFGPDTEGPRVRSIRVGLKIALPEAEGDYIQLQAKVLRFEGEKHPFFVLAPDDGKPDNRALVISEFLRAAHRENTGIDKTLTTCKVLDSTYGYGAFGSGVAFIAMMEPGQRICNDYSVKTRVITYNGNDLVIETIPRELLLSEENGNGIEL